MSAEPPRVAVIGAKGFIGSAVGRAFARRGVSTLQFTRECSFLDPPGQLVTEVDTIFWLAGSIRPATASADPQAVQADRDAISTLLDLLDEACARGRCRVVVVSSGGTVYDPSHPPPHRESSPVKPANAYGQAMLDLEEIVCARAPQSSILRVANAYGPGQIARRGQGVIAHWLDRIVHDQPITVMGDDTLARDYVYVDDVAEALVRVHEAESVPEVVNIGSGHGTGLGELLDAVRVTVAPRGVVVERQPSRGFDAPSTWLAIELAADALGWQPTVGLADGLAQTWRTGQTLATR